ncbi:hypothetical protein [Trinickia dinghuensis]|uniref:Uncharacterized protein n=1 Tax=Trinickia dinghuensis TaxID=2291023 RepID=A0A3D8K2B9_9BURK|nr:hypothetical protein [Trinickia dinghuensis]RDU99202.1 hypothetical protein DWV00_08740 [Trinickia dinghuensis]
MLRRLIGPILRRLTRVVVLYLALSAALGFALPVPGTIAHYWRNVLVIAIAALLQVLLPFCFRES